MYACIILHLYVNSSGGILAKYNLKVDYLQDLCLCKLIIVDLTNVCLNKGKNIFVQKKGI